MNKAAWRGLFFVVLASLALVALVGGAGFLALRKLSPVLTPLASPARRAAESEAAKPINIPAKARTAADVHRDFSACPLDALPASYRQFGVRKPAWDAPALAFLEAYAREGVRIGDNSVTPGLMQAAQSLLRAGCSDPLVLGRIGVLLENANQPKEAFPCYNRAVQACSQAHYPKKLIWTLPMGLAVTTDRSKPENTPRVEQLVKLSYQWLSEGSHGLTGQEPRVLWNQVRDIMAILPFERQPQLLKVLQADPQADPWLTNMLGGSYHIDAAWRARGSGWAKDVTEEGWQGFNDHLRQARVCLEKAYQLRPDFPSAPTAMMTVALGEDTGATEERQWFDRAIAAQADYQEAYSKYSWCLTSRWGGSEEAILRFGEACADTKRFDLDIPRQLYTATLDIERFEGDPGVWKRPRVYAKFKATYEAGLQAASSQQFDLNALKSWQAAAAWRCGHLDDAKQLLDELGPNVRENIFSDWFHTTSKAVRQEVSGAKAGGQP